MCRDCELFIADRNQCVIHFVAAEIMPKGKCDYFHQGPMNGRCHELFYRGQRRGYQACGMKPLGLFTKKQSGYVDDAKPNDRLLI